MMSEKPLYIGIGNKCRQGKDTFASALHAQMPDSCVIGFADALKKMCRDFYGMKGKDPELLQRIGLQMRHLAYDDIWIRKLEVVVAMAPKAVVIIPDVRFPNEADFIHRKGGFLVHAQRVNPDGTPFIASDRDPAHISETALDGFTDWDYAFTASTPEEVAQHALEFSRFLGLARAA